MNLDNRLRHVVIVSKPDTQNEMLNDRPKTDTSLRTVNNEYDALKTQAEEVWPCFE